MVTLPIGSTSSTRKISGSSRYDQLKKGNVLDYTDTAYKEAVSKLKAMLNENYTPSNRHHSHVKLDDSDDEGGVSGMSLMLSDTTRMAKINSYRKPNLLQKAYPSPKLSPTVPDSSQFLSPTAPPELLSFIERQEEYIEQLEKESQYCRDELSLLLGKVKELISENEALHEQQKTNALKNVFDCVEDRRQHAPDFECKLKHLEGPSIVFESRISELEAQLTQARLDLKKCHDEHSGYKRSQVDLIGPSPDFYRQIETLQREKRELSESLSKLQSSVAQLRDKENDTCRKVQRSQGVAEKAQLDRQQAEMEVQRLKGELEHQHERLLDVLSEQTRKVAEERNQAERRYHQHVEQLSSELASQRDISTKLQLELDRHLRTEEDLRRDLSAKNITIENVRKELNAKIASIHTELSSALLERDTIEQELSTSKMSEERSERVNRQEVTRLQVEVNALRQRSERNEAELIHARRENLRLAEQVSTLENEIALHKMRLEDKEDPKEKEEEEKRAQTVRELESLVEKQSHAMTLLTNQCHSLAQKLDGASARHKQEMAELQSNLEFLTSRLESSVLKQWPTVETGNFGETENQSFPERFAPDAEYPSTEQIPKEPDLYSGQEILPNANMSPNYEQAPRQRSTPPVSEPNITQKSNLSRSSSRGERSESPISKRDPRRSPVQRPDSRMGISQSPTQYTSPPRSKAYSPDTTYQAPNNQQYYGSDQPSYNMPDGNEYNSSIQQQNPYIPDDVSYAPQTDYEPNQYQYGQQIGEISEPKQYEYGSSNELLTSHDSIAPETYYQPDAQKPELSSLRNRTPSRESLRNMPESPRKYQESLRERIPSNESLSSMQHPQPYAPQDLNTLPYNQPYDASQPQDAYPAQESYLGQMDSNIYESNIPEQQTMEQMQDEPLVQQNLPPRQDPIPQMKKVISSKQPDKTSSQQENQEGGRQRKNDTNPSVLRAQQKFQGSRQQVASSNESLSSGSDGPRTKLPPQSPSGRRENTTAKQKSQQRNVSNK